MYDTLYLNQYKFVCHVVPIRFPTQKPLIYIVHAKILIVGVLIRVPLCADPFHVL